MSIYKRKLFSFLINQKVIPEELHSMTTTVVVDGRLSVKSPYAGCIRYEET
jgi:hypothetical protein